MRLAFVAWALWFIAVLYGLMDSCWMVGTPDEFMSFGRCTAMDGVQFFFLVFVLPVLIPIGGWFLYRVITWVVEGFNSERPQ